MSSIEYKTQGDIETRTHDFGWDRHAGPSGVLERCTDTAMYDPCMLGDLCDANQCNCTGRKRLA